MASPARAPVASDREQPLAKDCERGSWIAPLGDVGIELVCGGGEPLRVLPIADRGQTVAHQQRTGLQQITGGFAAELVASHDP